jgi:antirestriction protein
MEGKTMSEQKGEIRFYVACLAAYNNGILHGRWIDACQDEEAIRTEIGTMLKASPVEDAEEYAIHDYEGFEGARIEEYSAIAEVCVIAAFVKKHGTLGGKLLEHFGDLDDVQKAIGEHYAGCFKTVSEFAQEITEETTTIPDGLRYYIDYDAMARDMEINDVLTIEVGFEEVHIFWRH